MRVCDASLVFPSIAGELFIYSLMLDCWCFSFPVKLKKDLKKVIFVDLLTFDCATTQGGATVSSCSVAMPPAAQPNRRAG